MSTEATWQTSTTGSLETELLGERIGQNLKGGEVIELISDLGGGKTTFVRGLAKGIGSQSAVASPSFTIKREYTNDDLIVHHYDFYRLQDPGLIQHEIGDVINDPRSVVVVEWGDIVQGVLPKKRLKINIKSTGETTRQFTISYPENLEYMIRGAK